MKQRDNRPAPSDHAPRLDRPPIFFGADYDGVLVPVAWTGFFDLVLPIYDPKSIEPAMATYCRFDISAYGIATTAWLPVGDTPWQYLGRIRLYLSSGLRTHPRAPGVAEAFPNN